MSSQKRHVGGVIHTYQKYDPKTLPQPDAAAARPGLRGLRAHAAYGDMRELTEEELARAVQLDPSQIAGLGPSLDCADGDAPRAEAEDPGNLRDRPRPGGGRRATTASSAAGCSRPSGSRERFQQAFRRRAALRPGAALVSRRRRARARSPGSCVQLVDRLGDKYQVDELAAKYAFTGRTPMTDPQALEIKEELETIDRLLKQLEEAAKNGPDRRDRHGGAGRVRRAGRHRAAARAGPSRSRSTSANWPSSRAWRQTARGYRAHAQGLSPVSGPAAGADLQQAAGLADRPAPGPGGGRRGGRTAADQALRVRRLGGQHGHPRLADQRHGPRRRRACPCGSSPKTSRSTARATRPSAPRSC